MEYQIRKGLPKPDALRPVKDKGETRYPFANMEPGDCFIVSKTAEAPNLKTKAFRQRVYMAARRYREMIVKVAPGLENLKYTVMTLGPPNIEKGEDWEAGDVGVWRDA